MPDALFAPVFTAQPQALTAALDRAAIRPDMAEPNKGRVVALVRSVLPDVLETPTRVKRLNNAVVDWLSTSPPTWSELEATRQEFNDLITDFYAKLTRV